MATLKVVALASADNPDAALLAIQAELSAADEVCEALYRQVRDKYRRGAPGLEADEKAANAADEVRMAIRDKIVATRARTLAGLIFKARYAAPHLEDYPDEDVMLSILDDLLAMAGDVV